MQVANGTADVTTYFVLRDSTNHAPKTDVTITDIDLYYCEQGAAMAAKVDTTALAAADSAHADNKAFHVGQGLYRIDWPDTCFNGGVGKVTNLIVVCTGVDTTFLEVELTDVPQTGDNYARLGAPVGASISADIATNFAALSDDAAIADAVHDEVIEDTYTMRQLLRGFAAVLLGKSANGGADYRDLADTKYRIDSTIDENGNRTSVTLDLS